MPRGTHVTPHRGPRRPRALHRARALPVLAGRRGRPRPGAGRAGRHSRGGRARDRPQGAPLLPGSRRRSGRGWRAPDTRWCRWCGRWTAPARATPAATCTGARPPRTSRRPASSSRCAGPTTSSCASSPRFWPRWADLAERTRTSCSRPHARPARGARHLRLQGGGVDRRARPSRGASAGLRAARVRGHAGRRRRDARLAGRARPGHPGEDGGAAGLHPMPMPARTIGDHQAEYVLLLAHARGHLQQDRTRDLHA